MKIETLLRPKILAMMLISAGMLSAQISQPSVGSAPTSPPRDEIKSIAIALRGNRAALMKLKPTAAQVAQIAAAPEDAAKLNAYVEKLYASVSQEGLTSSSPDQTDVFVNLDMPGGYERIKGRLKPGVTVYGFKYAVPGQTTGMAYDGLIKLDGQWILIPKLWRAFSD